MKNALKAAKQSISRSLTEEYYLKQGEINRSIKPGISAKTTKYHTSFIKITGQRLSLEHYKLSPSKRGKKPKTLYGAVKREGGLKSLGSAFLYAPHGKYKPFQRIGSPRLPIEKLVGPAIPQLVQWNERLQERAIAEARNELLNALREVSMK